MHRMHVLFNRFSFEWPIITKPVLDAARLKRFYFSCCRANVFEHLMPSNGFGKSKILIKNFSVCLSRLTQNGPLSMVHRMQTTLIYFRMEICTVWHDIKPVTNPDFRSLRAISNTNPFGIFDRNVSKKLSIRLGIDMFMSYDRRDKANDCVCTRKIVFILHFY